jgi:hypothetical protein
MEVPLWDCQIIIDGFPTLASIITASEEEMQLNSPAEYQSIQRITSFFSCCPPTMKSIGGCGGEG